MIYNNQQFNSFAPHLKVRVRAPFQIKLNNKESLQN